MKQEVDLQHLINLPFGAASRELKKAGFWKEENAAEDGRPMKYRITVRGTYDPQVEKETVDVTAASVEEAHVKAADMTDFDTIERTEVVWVRELDA